MQSSDAQNLGPEVAFVSSSLHFRWSFSRKSICQSRPRRHISKTSHQQTKAVLDKQIPADDSRDNNSHSNGESESFPNGKYDAEVVMDSATYDVPGFENPWYSVVERIGHDDKGDGPEAEEVSENSSAEDVVDLMKLEGVGQQMLAGSSYDKVVDVDIEEGGLLDDDEDNNDLHCGVELDALVESPVLIENLRNDFGIETATHVQLAAIPRVLDGSDIVIQSHTGTGKTLAFLLPILDEVDATVGSTQAMIIAPTRELAMQISRECDRLISGTEIRSLALIGGANPARQVEKLRKKQPHVVVGTPGRLAELHGQRVLRTHGIRWFVVDEVDQCLGEAFFDHVVKLLKAVREKQIILVSATGDVDGVRQFAATHLDRPVLLRVGGSQRIPKCIEHYCCVVPARKKIEVLKKLMSTSPIPNRAIAFVDDPRRVDIVVEKLYQMGLIAGGLKGTAHKMERADVLAAIKKGRINLLVTTEVAARGLDLREVTHVFNLDLPTDGDHYLHRAGRCGRAGEKGFVVSIAAPDKAFVVSRLAAELSIEIPRMEVRYGRYSQSVERAREEAGSATRRVTSSFAPSDFRDNAGGLIAKKQRGAGRERNTVDSLGTFDGLERRDTDSIDKRLQGRAEAAIQKEDGEIRGIMSKPRKKKEKLKGKLKAKAKARAKTKAELSAKKAKSAEQKARRKAENEDKEEMGDEDVGTRRERRDYNRRRSDLSYRATSEGWVGNRLAMKEEDDSS